MRDKVNPHGLRVGVIRNWDSKWDPASYNSINIVRINDNLKNYISLVI